MKISFDPFRHLAAWTGWLTLLAALCLDAGGSPLEPMIFQSIKRGDNALLETLLEGGSSPNARLEDGTTPLMLAALFGDGETLRLLLDHGGEVKAANREGVTALLWGAGDAEKVSLLLDHRADPHARSQLGRTPLMVAAAHPKGSASVKHLLEAGAEPNQPDLLYAAAGAGNLESIDILLTAGSRKGLDRALLQASSRGFSDIAERLLREGADPNWMGGSRSTHALNHALLGEHVETAQLLLNHGASLTTTTPNGEPPLMLAAYTEHGDDTILRAILEKDVDLEVANHREETAFSWAHKRGHDHLAKLLTDRGAPASPAEVTKVIPDRDISLHAGNRQSLLRASVTKSLPLMLNSSDVFLKNRESCVSCHHQNIPSMAFGLAGQRGFQMDEAAIDRLVQRQREGWSQRIDRAYQMHDPVPVPPRFLGWGILGWAAVGYQPDAITDAMTWYLRAIQQPEGYWANDLARPPMGGTEIVGTTLALRSIQLYPPPGNLAASEAAVAAARAWLLEQEPETLQDRLSHLLGLAWTGSSPEALRSHADPILASQCEDGGWAQLPGLESDAWATGQTLYALYTTGFLKPNQPGYEAGLRFLLNTQFDDGSWYVASRSWPFQPHFDSAFPHGKHQWISVAGTAWATIAMLLAMDPVDEATAAALRESHSLAKNPERDYLVPEGELPFHVDFVTDIKPLLERSCVACHGGQNPKGHFHISDRAGMLRGGESGHPAIVPGQPAESRLLELVSDRIEDMEMPPVGKRDRYPALATEEIRLLAGWIQSGAAWPDTVRLQAQE